MTSAAVRADLIKWFHAGFVIFAILGGLLLWWLPVLAWLHLPIVLWAGAINIVGWTCPLTPLENRLRLEAGQQGYAGGFIQHYVERAGFAGLGRRTLEARIGWGILLWNLVLYALACTIAA